VLWVDYQQCKEWTIQNELGTRLSRLRDVGTWILQSSSHRHACEDTDNTPFLLEESFAVVVPSCYMLFFSFDADVKEKVTRLSCFKLSLPRTPRKLERSDHFIWFSTLSFGKESHGIWKNARPAPCGQRRKRKWTWLKLNDLWAWVQARGTVSRLNTPGR
jgi:hypothetical protein